MKGFFKEKCVYFVRILGLCASNITVMLLRIVES